jgi:hypothetical protein
MERALEEGKRFDQELTEFAEREVTPALLQGSEEEEGDEDDDAEESQTGGRSRSRKGARSERRITG